MHIAPLADTHISACAALMASAPLWQRYGVTEASAQAVLRQSLSDGGHGFVAVERDAVAGFVLCYLRGAFVRSAYIRLIGVAASAQSQGVGAALMQAAEAEARQISPDMFLLVSDFNTAAQRFYRRLGYEQVGALPDYVLPSVSELIFRKRLR